MLISPQVLIRLFIVLLYGLLCLFAYRLIMPRLIPAARRLAILMLLAQIAVIAVSVEFRAEWGLDDWLWNIDQEWNIPSALASTQLALVGSAALAAALLANKWPAWQRMYLSAMGLIFLFLARDEYVKIHEGIQNWEIVYAALGVAVALATVVVAIRSPRPTWKWHLCLLAGLALSALGGIGIEQLRPDLQGPICDNMGWLRLEGCLLTYEYEETLEFAGMWLALLGVLGHFSDCVPGADSRARRLLYVLPVLWILWLINDPFSHRQFLVRPASILFESGVELLDFSVARQDKAVIVNLDASARRGDHEELGYSVHLVDQVRGDSVAGRDARWCCQQGAIGDILSFRQSVAVDIPADAPVNRALWIVLTIWRETDGEFEGQPVLAGELQLLDATQVVLGELVIRAKSIPPSGIPLAVFDNGFTLSAAEMPARARSGETLAVTFSWRSDKDGHEDLTQFLHFVREQSGESWGYDQPPLGQRLPTRLWYSGLADSETWGAPLPDDLAPGRYSVFTGLY